MSVQNGWIEVRQTKRGRVFLLRYRVRDDSRPSGWRTMSEPLDGCKTRKEAEKERQRRLPKINYTNEQQVKTAQGDVRTVRQFVENEWELYLEGQDVKVSTSYSYASMLAKYILPKLGDMRLDQVERKHVSEVFGRLKGKSPKYKVNVWNILHLVFDLAVEHRLINANPVSRTLHRLKKTGRGREEKPVLTASEIRAVIAEIPGEWRNLFLLLTQVSGSARHWA